MFLLCTLINIRNVGKNNSGASKLKKGRNHVVSGNQLVTHYEFKRLLAFHFFLKKIWFLTVQVPSHCRYVSMVAILDI